MCVCACSSARACICKSECEGEIKKKIGEMREREGNKNRGGVLGRGSEGVGGDGSHRGAPERKGRQI